MPKNIAQWTAFAVTAIVVLGRDADVFTAVPLGIAAGMLANFFQIAMRWRLRPARLRLRLRLRPMQLSLTPLEFRRALGLLVRASSFAASQLRGTVALPRQSLGEAGCAPLRPKRRHVQFQK